MSMYEDGWDAAMRTVSIKVQRLVETWRQNATIEKQANAHASGSIPQVVEERIEVWTDCADELSAAFPGASKTEGGG